MLGTLYPAYASYKAVKTKNVKEYVSVIFRDSPVIRAAESCDCVIFNVICCEKLLVNIDKITLLLIINTHCSVANVFSQESY